MQILVADHDPAWASWFEQLRARIWPAVSAVALRLEHVGSTAVPGLAAKPVIDLDVVVADRLGMPPVIERLVGIGYEWRRDLGIEGRDAFRFLGPEPLPRHHLYLVVDGSKPHLDHVLLRDLLRRDDESRDRYAALKRRNAELADGDMERYVELKHDLVTELLERARRALA